IMVCWGGGATAAAILGSFQTGCRPALGRAVGWWREHWDITPRFLGSELVNMAGSQLVTFAVGGIVGLAAVGSLRGAQLLLGPVYVMAVGVQMSLVPEAARMIDSPARLRRLSFGVTGLLTAGGAAYGLVVLLLPDAIGRGVLGASWDGAHAVLLPMAVMWVGPLLTLGPRIGLRALEEAARTLQVSSLQSVSTLIGGVVGALFGGTLGAAWGMAIGVILSIAAWWLQYRLALRRHVERGVALGRQQQPPPAARPDQPSRAVPPGGA
ncbi:MAG TPA: hypothetical protein VIV06_00810, partial [Candidatus Limnocylindrales bacterium]